MKKKNHEKSIKINRPRKVKNKRLIRIELIITWNKDLRFRIRALKHPRWCFKNLDGFVSQKKVNFWKNWIVLNY